MAKRPDNIYSWLLARWWHHKNIYKGEKEVNFKDLLQILDRSEKWIKEQLHDKCTDNDIIDNQLFRIRKYLRAVREGSIKFDMTDMQSHYDYDLLPKSHKFYIQVQDLRKMRKNEQFG